MTGRLDYAWRFVATGASFAVFGLCGVVFSALVFPLMQMWPQKAARQRAAAWLIHAFFRTLVRVLRIIGVMTVELAGARKLREPGPMIVVANHPTYLDVMVLLALTPRACCVVKHAHWRRPSFWGIVRAAGYVSNDDPLKLVEDCARQLDAGYTLLVFPEGTRSPARNRLHDFSRGFAYVALATRAPLVPVLLHCEPPAFTKDLRWYDVPARAFCISVTVLDALDAGHLARPGLPQALAARDVTRAVQTHINQHLYDHGFFETGH